MKNQSKESKIDLKYLFFKFYANWYYFVIALVLTLFAAYVFNKLSDKVYEVNSTILIEPERKGPTGAGELLEIIEVKQRYIQMEDEIGKLTSYSMVQEALGRLDFGVSYFTVPDIWLNTFGNLKVEEKSPEDFPFKVIVDPTVDQLANVPIYIKVLSKNKIQVQAEGERVYLYNIQNNKSSDESIDQVNIDKTINIEQPYQDKYLSFKVVLNKPIQEFNQDKYYFVINTLNSLTKTYQGKIQAKSLSRDARIVVLSTEGRVPEKEIRFLNTLMEVYLSRDVEEKHQTGIKAITFIDNQLADVSDSLTKVENDLQTFRRSTNGLDNGYEKFNVFEKLDQLEKEKANITAQVKNYNTMLNHMESKRDLTSSIPPSTAGISDNTLIRNINELTLLYQEKSKMELSARGNHFGLQQVETRIQPIRAAIIENLRTNIRDNNNAVARINQRVAEIQTNVSRLPEHDRKRVDLQRKFDYNNETHNFLIQKRAEAAIALATNSPDGKVIDSGKVASSTPVSPKTNAIFLIAFLVGIFIPASSIVASDFFDDTIKTKEDIREMTEIPVLGMIAHSNSSKNGYLARGDSYKSAISESFRSLRVNLQYLAVGMDQKAIGITSSISGEGKTFCAINLCTVLALSGKKAILIDADMRKPRVAQYLDLKNTFGLSSYLIKNNTLEEVIQPTKVKNFDVIASGPIPPNPIELMEIREMKELINRLKGSYDYIVLDTPPLGFVSEYMILKQYLDVNIYIVRSGYTKKEALSVISELYENKAIDNLSIVINDVNFSSTYGYSYKNKAKAYGYV